MNKRITVNFLKDKISFTIAFFLNSFLITIFYYISTKSQVEFLYPFSISIFIYLIYMLVEFFRYYRFNSKLSKCADNMYFDVEPVTCEQKEISGVINQIQENFVRKVNDVQLENQQKRHFLSKWVHNMKTPVSVIDLIIQKAVMEKGENSDELFKDIKEENEKLLSSLEQALSLFRLDEFSRDYVPEAIDLVKTVKKVINSRKNQFIYNKVYPKIQVESDSVMIFSDGKWNEAMIDQLVSNAIKYSAEDNAEKYIYFTIDQKDGEATLTIKDEGIGIPEFDLNRVFEPFFTGENGRKFKNATGIGLYICAAIAEKLGHRIDLKSEVGVGTEVTISYMVTS